jgi:methylglutaconyl-CoA hydratase
MMKFLKTSEEGPFFKIQLNRPEIHNAFNPEMIEEIRASFAQMNQRKDIRAVILSGEGKSFCAGGDLSWMQDMVKYSPEQNKEDAARLFAMFQQIYECPVPVIGVAHGSVFGGGLGLLGCCDYVIAEEKTKFCFSEVKLGIAPAVISVFILRKCPRALVGPSMILGTFFNAQTALSMGLVHEIADEESLPDRVEMVLASLKEVGPEAIRSTKRLLNQIPELSLEEIKEEVCERIAELRVGREGQEGLRSFLEKRRASWKL